MKRVLSVALAVVALLTGVAAQPAAEWVSLFDGKAITHWRGFKMATVPDGWRVVDGTITRVGDGTDLVSREQYRNFEFEFEWKVPPAGNSGIMFRVTEELDRTYHSGPEFQVLDNSRHADGKNPLTSAGANYALHAPVKDVTRPVGEWNQGRLVVNGNDVQHWLNGTKVVEYTLGTAEWNAMVKDSKFNEWPRYGRETSGHLVIQDHGDRVQFRNLRVRRLP